MLVAHYSYQFYSYWYVANSNNKMSGGVAIIFAMVFGTFSHLKNCPVRLLS